MDTLSFGFVLLIIALGGLTAYIADFLGRLLGKKRLSVFGLRPKHTAVLFTTFAGVLIPLLTVLTLMTLSKEVRVWLTEGQSAVEERNRKVTELKLVNARVSQKTEEVIQLEDQKRDAFQKMKEAETNLKAFKEKAKKLQHQASLLKHQIKEFRKDILSMNQRYKQLESNHHQLQQDSKGLYSANQQLTLIGDNLKKELNEKILLSGRLEAQMVELQSRVDNLNQQKEEVLVQYDRLSQTFQKDIESAKADLEAARNEKEKAESEIQLLQNIRSNLETGLHTNVHHSRLSPIIFHQGEELLRLRIKANQTKSSVKKVLGKLLEQANQIALERGAQPAGRYQQAAGLADLPLNHEILTREEQEETIIQDVVHSSTPTVLIAQAFWNTYKGEYAILKISSHKNPLIYKKDALLGTAVIDGTAHNEQILEQIMQFINTKLRPKVESDKIIPVSTPEPQYIEVPYTQMWNLVTEIKTRNSQVQISAITDSEVYASDLVKFRFKIQ